MAGIPFDRGRERFDRLAEAVRIVKLAFAGQAFSFDGAYYHVREYTSYPKPAQSRLPLMLGGGGRRLLSLAAAEADIVSVLPAAGPGGFLCATQLTIDSLREKIAVLRAAAPDRWAEMEVNILIFDVTVTMTGKPLPPSTSLSWTNVLASSRLKGRSPWTTCSTRPTCCSEP
jgi:alkanesulfonate monooxygenase SsuD/methylene tetrahydromethanopterin reductase-like flavin-dependent oxidoreductase (luciferase family)